MTFTGKMKRAALVSLVAIPMLTAGCGLLGSQESKGQIDPPPGVSENAPDAAASGNAVTVAADELQQPVTLYLKDSNGYVAPVSLNVPRVDGIAKLTLQYLVEDGEYKDLIPGGFTALLPKGTEIKGISVDAKQKLATVNFSKQFVNYNVQDERKMLEALTYTLTSFPSIQQVQIQVEGKPLAEMPENGTPLDEPLTRGMGINIEKGKDVELTASTPVTLYFMSKTDDDQAYFVPVTRLISRTDNVAQAAVQQLIEGPSAAGTLISSIDPGAQVLDVTQKDGIVTVNLSGEIETPEAKVPAETLESVILSLTENTGAAKVQIMVNGNKKVSSTDDKSYSQPVTRPAHVNPVKS
ncbi:GerMN domain-containing protein [Paenibacillus gansuensis]|uniref:GerMN domain-containing protein n=1 Tax=Paenibacillus gansuensis TaxID=306542 RepID=A0ABW5PC35_9BACL